MKGKKLILVLLAMALFAMTVILAACDNNNANNREPGEETGIYYFDSTDGEYLLSLNGGNRFALQIKDETVSGTFTIDGAKIEFSPLNNTKLSASATYGSSSIELTYDGTQMSFLRRTEYTVTFDGTDLPAVKVVNGKKLTRPQDPVKDTAVFLGWYSDNTYSTLFDFNTTIVRNTTIYAKWTDSASTGNEYTITFISDGSDNIEVRTIGGKVYEVPSVTSGNKTFNGWWLSDYDDGTKLSRRFSDSMIFDENTNVYALWDSKAPLAEVTDKGVKWDAISGATVTVEVKNSQGEKVSGVGGTGLTGTECAIDWNVLESDNYTVEVSASNSTEKAVRYYINKMLKKVSSYVVEGGNFVFTPVPNAQKYTITVVCGDSRHQHENFDLQNYNSFNFSNCPMKEGGITFVVTAEAEGYASSTSQTFVIDRTLDKAGNFNYSEITGVLSWNKVNYATGYILTITNGDAEPTVIDNGNNTSFDLKGLTGNISVVVSAKAKGFLSSQSEAYTLNKTQLATPQNVRADGTMITWDEVTGATKYTVKVNAYDPVVIEGANGEAPVREYNLTSIAGFTAIADGTELNVTVQAANSTSESLWTDTTVVRKVTFGSHISYNNSVLTWEYCSAALRYQVYVNGDLYLYRDNEDLLEDDYIGVNSAEIIFEQSGVNELFVRCFFAGDITTDSETITVYTHAVTVVTDMEDPVTTLYKAVNDKIDLGIPEKEGYTFRGWYNTLSGASGNGAQYTDTTFIETNDIVLYADWEALPTE